MTAAAVPPQTAGETRLTTAVRAEQVRLLYEAAGPPMFVTLIAAGALVLLVLSAKAIAPIPAALWWAYMAFHTVVRLFVRRAYLRARPPDGEWRRWAQRFLVGAVAGGLGWGLGSWILLVPGHLDLQMVCVAVLFAIAYGTATAWGSYLPAFYAFFWPTFLPVLAWFAVRGGEHRWLIVVMFLLWIPTVASLARRYSRTLTDALELRFRNDALVEDLRAQKAIAEQASLAKSRFLASASHDLRQPVHALGMFVGALRGLKLPARARTLIDHVDASVGAMDGLFMSLLDISRLDAGVVEAAPAPVAVQPLVSRICRDLTGEATAKGISLKSAPTRLAVVSDPVHLERILRNLIGNAVRYTARGGVLVGARREGARCGGGAGVRLEVWDTGPGIAEAEREAVFEEFYQLANPDRDRGKGLGLGLPIVRRLALILGHELSLASRPGRGTVFRLSLARAEPPPAPAAAALAPLAEHRAGVVLVVDDEAAIRVGMSELLGGWGHLALAAADADEALALVAHAGVRPDLIVSDYRLRGDDGIAVIRRLNAAFGATPAILLTGDTAPERLREAEASGYPLLHKPVAHGRLRAAVTNLLRRSSNQPPG
jgi:signal transduction histidine kinase/CheY-like chemotaxis protein